ncbi:MAG TPA: hypothetical protein VHD38_01530 [Candidatus Paceibacterota bacterium]|nr:hypothetical protein [Candidatus Paceibacterota bacterium]
MGAASWKQIVLLCCVFAIIVAGYLFRDVRPAQAGAYPEAATIGSGNPSFDALADRFRDLAQKKGGVYAFDILKIAQLPPGIDLHLMGHVVGDELYKQKGVDGIEFCTQDFRNACSHAIVIGTLNEFGAGDATVEKIREACKKAPGGTGAYTMCFHGLGHGVFAYFGYDIPKAVDFCKRLGTPAYNDLEYTQCVGGIIMELIDGGGHDHDQWVSANEKYLDPNDPLSPCDRSLIPEEAKSFCIMYLTPHLFEAAGANLGNPDPVFFPKAFSFCDGFGDSRLRDMCYSSFGKEFIPLAASRDIRSVDQMSDTQYQLAIQWCMLAPHTEAQTQCIHQALASVFWGGENNPDASFRFCSLVGDADIKSSCYSELGRDINTYTTGDTRTELCNKLPAEDVKACTDTVPDPA